MIKLRLHKEYYPGGFAWDTHPKLKIWSKHKIGIKICRLRLYRPSFGFRIWIYSEWKTWLFDIVLDRRFTKAAEKEIKIQQVIQALDGEEFPIGCSTYKR